MDGNISMDDNKIHGFMVGSKGKHMVCMFVVRFISGWQRMHGDKWLDDNEIHG